MYSEAIERGVTLVSVGHHMILAISEDGTRSQDSVQVYNRQRNLFLISIPKRIDRYVYSFCSIQENKHSQQRA